MVSLPLQATTLASGVPISNLSGSKDSIQTFDIAVPSDSVMLKMLVIQISGGTGDVDLYVKQGSQPTSSVYDCRPYLGGNNEICSFQPPTAGIYYINLSGYAAYSGVTLTATLTTSTGPSSYDGTWKSGSDSFVVSGNAVQSVSIYPADPSTVCGTTHSVTTFTPPIPIIGNTFNSGENTGRFNTLTSASATFKFSFANGGCSGTSTVTSTYTLSKANQTITFGPAPTVIVGGTGPVSATGGLSGNPVVFSSTTPGVCTVSGSTLTGVTAGSCTIAANQAGNANFNDAPQVTQTFNVTGLALTVINGSETCGTIISDTGGIACGATCSANFDTVGAPVKLTAIPVTGYQFSGWGGSCSGGGNTYMLTMDAAKSCTAKFEVFKKKRRPSWRGLLSQ